MWAVCTPLLCLSCDCCELIVGGVGPAHILDIYYWTLTASCTAKGSACSLCSHLEVQLQELWTCSCVGVISHSKSKSLSRGALGQGMFAGKLDRVLTLTPTSVWLFWLGRTRKFAPATFIYREICRWLTLWHIP